jgi:hypothetical protein
MFGFLMWFNLLLYVLGYGSTYFLGTRDQIHESCKWVFITTEIAKIMTMASLKEKLEHFDPS